MEKDFEFDSASRELGELEALLAKALQELQKLDEEKDELRMRADNGSESALLKLQSGEENSISRRIAAKSAEVGRIEGEMYSLTSNAEAHILASQSPGSDYS